ncbi:MAG: hypothetical protein KJO32_05435 [Deltaproteobacteria bacterium]|nr:hypothetical protein [Deltaproteobacteria bacterium]
MPLSMSLRKSKTIIALVAVLGLSVVGSPAAASGVDGSNQSAKSANGEQARSRALAAIKKATLQFADVNNALDAGYVSTVDLGAGCVSSESEGGPRQLGGMGIHFVKLDEIGAPESDFMTPSVLVYAPDPDVEHCSYSTGELMTNYDCADSLRLVAVEELIFAHLWQPASGEAHWEAPPEFHGNQFYYVHDNPETDWVDEAHAFPPHYELHIWLYEHNPAGLFAAWNPTISCPAHMQGGHH